ncbi:MAG TPA: hypothetical protein VF731_01315 [Solirubrobacterales bacterium]
MARIWRLGIALVAVLAVGGTAAASAQAGFVAGSYPAKLSGTQLEQFIFFSAAAELKCKTSDFAGELTEAASSLSLTARTEGCSTGGGIVVMAVSMNGCTYRFTQGAKVAEGEWSSGLKIECPMGKEIVWENPEHNCVARTPAQEVSSTSTLRNTAKEPGTILLTTAASGIHYTLEKTFGCVGMPAPGTYTNGKYQGTAELSAANPETSKGIDLRLE